MPEHDDTSPASSPDSDPTLDMAAAPAAGAGTVVDGVDGGGRGRRVGPFVLERLLGEGGFGAVYLAGQEQPVRRRVALKIIKPGMDSRDVLQRFDQERQALAIMDHPGIAKIFDAGTTESGRVQELHIPSKVKPWNPAREDRRKCGSGFYASPMSAATAFPWRTPRSMACNGQKSGRSLPTARDSASLRRGTGGARTFMPLWDGQPRGGI